MALTTTPPTSKTILNSKWNPDSVTSKVWKFQQDLASIWDGTHSFLGVLGLIFSTCSWHSDMLILFPIHIEREFTIWQLGSPIVFISADDITAIHAWDMSVLCVPTHSRLTLTTASNGPHPRAESLSGILQPQLQRPNSALRTTNSVLKYLPSIACISQKPTAAGYMVCGYFFPACLAGGCLYLSKLWGVHDLQVIIHLGWATQLLLSHTHSWKSLQHAYQLSTLFLDRLFLESGTRAPSRIQTHELYFLKKGHLLWNTPCCEKST